MSRIEEAIERLHKLKISKYLGGQIEAASLLDEDIAVIEALKCENEALRKDA